MVSCINQLQELSTYLQQRPSMYCTEAVAADGAAGLHKAVMRVVYVQALA